MLEGRLGDLLSRLPPLLEDDFRRYRAARLADQVGSSALNAPGIEGMYWLQLPGWLLSKHSTEPAPADDLLADVLWAQYCVFLAVRTRDDLFDEQTALTALDFVADRLLLEASGTLERRFPPGSPTRRFLAASLGISWRAIREVDRAHRVTGATPAETLPLYAEVGRIFGLGAVAVCERTGRAEDLPPALGFCDQLAMAGQIVDDLGDMFADLARNRVNYAARWLLEREPAAHRRAGDLGPLVTRALLHGEGTAELFEQVRTRLERARDAIEPLRLQPAERFVADRLVEVDRLADDLWRRLAGSALGTANSDWPCLEPSAS